MNLIQNSVFEIFFTLIEDTRNLKDESSILDTLYERSGYCALDTLKEKIDDFCVGGVSPLVYEQGLYVAAYEINPFVTDARESELEILIACYSCNLEDVRQPYDGNIADLVAEVKPLCFVAIPKIYLGSLRDFFLSKAVLYKGECKPLGVYDTVGGLSLKYEKGKVSQIPETFLVMNSVPFVTLSSADGKSRLPYACPIYTPRVESDVFKNPWNDLRDARSESAPILFSFSFDSLTKENRERNRGLLGIVLAYMKSLGYSSLPFFESGGKEKECRLTGFAFASNRLAYETYYFNPKFAKDWVVCDLGKNSFRFLYQTLDNLEDVKRLINSVESGEDSSAFEVSIHPGTCYKSI